LTTQQLHTASDLRDVAGYLQKSKMQVAYGGRIFNLLPELRDAIPAHFLGETIETALENTEMLISSKVKMPPGDPDANRHSEIALNFRHHLTLINMYTFTEAASLGMPFEYMITAIEKLGDNLYSALALGRLEALKIEFDWIRGLMQQHSLDETMLKPFLVAYANSIQKAMGQSGKEISDWLVEQANA
jgi:hypothetical protein